MVKSGIILSADTREKRKNRNVSGDVAQYKRLVSMGKISAGILYQLDGPIDSINRFINLALLTLEEGSQSRQFLLESKQGIRKTVRLLKRLNRYAKRMEKELDSIE
ncbi:MAG: hypothetical protein JW800_02090 [Candidatus Omnitrophica bacterium]|nr:hypothetical protein [Candidatus Omnitrophota bacterium]